MSSWPRPAKSLALAHAVPALLAWVVVREFFAIPQAPESLPGIALAVGAVCGYGLALLAERRLAAPIRTALGEPRSDPGLAQAAERAAHRLPARLAAVTFLIWGLLTLAGAAGLHRRAFPADASLALGAVGVAAAIVAAMLVYSWAAWAAAVGLAALDSKAEFRGTGTVRGKILAFGYGLLTFAVLLFAAGSYMRFRADLEAEYLRDGVQAQESALSAASGAPGAAELRSLSRATGGSAALFSGDGRLLGTAGPSGADLTPGPSGLSRLGSGWLLRRSAPGGATLVSFLPEAPLEARRLAYWRSAAGLVAAVYLAAAVLVWFAARAITVPLRNLTEAAGRVAAGDLAASPPSISRDELGELAAEFRRMASRLAGLVTAVQQATRAVDGGARELGDIGERVRRGALGQRSGLAAAVGAVGAMEGSIEAVSRGLAGLSQYVASTSGSVGEMAGALEEVRRQCDEMERSMEVALREVDGLSESGRRADVDLHALKGLADRTGDALARMEATLAGLDVAAVAGQLNTAQASELVERAGAVVEEAARGVERLRAAVADAQQRVTALGRRAGDVDQIVDFIADVAGRTNLLSLNASIIAAQAGEHGKAFGVVADQIRELAAQIASSTKSIAEIIGAVREDVEGTAALIARGDELAAAEVGLAQHSLRALSQIKAVAAQAHENAGLVQSAVAGHQETSREVARLVGSFAEASRAVAEAVSKVGTSVSALSSVARGVDGLADRLSHALAEQVRVGQGQLQSLERLEAMTGDVSRAVASHGEATRRVQESLRDLGAAAAGHEAVVGELAGVAGGLQQRARDLSERVERFKTG